MMFDLNLNRKVIEHISRNLNTQLLNPLNFICSLPGLKSWESNNTTKVLFIYFKQKKLKPLAPFTQPLSCLMAYHILPSPYTSFSLLVDLRTSMYCRQCCWLQIKDDKKLSLADQHHESKVKKVGSPR
ncbi:hypothetical protein V6Z12_D02G174400 [Gossypium hirsutum]